MPVGILFHNLKEHETNRIRTQNGMLTRYITQRKREQITVVKESKTKITMKTMTRIVTGNMIRNVIAKGDNKVRKR